MKKYFWFNYLIMEKLVLSNVDGFVYIFKGGVNS